jgi:DNA-binding beta-propeller fold protein YncE
MNRRRFLELAAMGIGTLVLGRYGAAVAEGEARDLVVVSNAGADGVGPSVSIIDPLRLEVLATLPLPGSYSFPANRWRFDRDVIWSGVPGGPDGAVFAYGLATGETLLEIPTGSSQNYTELTPDGRHLIVAARFEHQYLKVSADPGADDFGRVVAQFDTYEGAQPCDMTITADGAFAYAPDRGGDTLTVIRIEPFERVAVVPMERLSSAPLEPYMGTVSPAGDYLFIENAIVEGGHDLGSESIFDLRDPAHPVEELRLSQAEGLGEGPISSEFTWDGRYGIVICRDSSELTIVDTRDLQVVASVRLPEGSNPLTGTFARDGETFFVPLPGRDAVAAVSVPAFEIRSLVPVGPRPTGVVYLETRLPERPEVLVPSGAALATGRDFPADCPDRCCGPV